MLREKSPVYSLAALVGGVSGCNRPATRSPDLFPFDSSFVTT